MRKTLFAVLALASALAGWPGLARAELECAEPLFQAGPVRSGLNLNHRFVLVNQGNEPITIEGVKKGCGCVKAGVDRLVLAPGEEGACVVEVNTVTQADGPNTWRAIIAYRKGGRTLELPLFVTAEVLAEVTLSPATLIIQTETTLGHELTLRERRPQPLVITALETMSMHVRTRAGEPALNPEGHWVRTLSLEVLPTCPEGRYEDTLQIHTSDPEFPVLKLPFVVVKKASQKVKPMPSWVGVNGQHGEELPARLILLTGSAEEAVEILKVEADHPAIHCTFAPGPGARATLRVKIDQSRIEGDSLHSAVRVYLKKPTTQVLSVPVNCTLR